MEVSSGIVILEKSITNIKVITIISLGKWGGCEWVGGTMNVDSRLTTCYLRLLDCDEGYIYNTN